jgi:hypothetical protein
MSPRIRTGKVSSFDGSNWWGAVRLDGPDSSDVEFHATCFLGSSSRALPQVGDTVRITFSDDSAEKLLSVQALLPPAQ